MDMVEVDLELFVTCRLCLLDMGQFQIIPIVQQQIKFCFDIDVEPFDGLPQLICMKCKGMLTNFYTIKKTLCEKQAKLRSNKSKKQMNELCLQPQQDTVSSSQPATEVTENTVSLRKSKSKAKRAIVSSDSEDTCRVKSLNNKRRPIKRRPSWDWKGYKRTCICYICDSEWPNPKSLVQHRRVHFNLRAAHPSIFNKNCSVVLKKVDNKPNITGVDHIVVHSQDKIIENCNNTFYIKYSKEGYNSEFAVTLGKNKKHTDMESSDTEQEINAKPKRRKRQVLSRSSNDTVVIESNSGNKSPESDEDVKPVIKVRNAPIEQNSKEACISIDDSTESETETDQIATRVRTKQPLEAQLVDYKTLHSIITTCTNSHLRRNENSDKLDNNAISESHLKRKILSIGRKIINGHESNWTGFMRYIERKHLNLLWTTKTPPSNNNKESNYIRILLKLRDPEPDDSHLWVATTARNRASAPKPDTSVSVGRSMPSLTPNLNNNPQQPTMDATILLICSSPDPKNKLLNANPVANPKQLPRKLAPSGDMRLKPSVETNATFQNNEENDASMPIITSTTSLAMLASTNQDDRTPVATTTAASTTATTITATTTATTTTITNTTTPTDTPAPRIKVKPASELMSERTLNSLRNEQQSESTNNILLKPHIEERNEMVLNQVDNTNNVVLNQNVWPAPQGLSNMYTHIVPQLTVAGQPVQLVPLSCLNVTPSQPFPVSPPPVSTTSNNKNSKEEYVLLHTVELPNTKSNSPFKYLQKLLTMHNLSLLDPQDTLPREYVCLIKFKVQFKQEPIDEPVVLCLSLYCSKNKFCFTVKDRNQRNINIDKVSPNWQWEIINVFRGDLVDKLLQNSQKHSQETHDSTKKFLCLLKSIYRE